jgi:flagellar capping protein FliD
MRIDGSSGTQTSAASSKGFSGMASGVDTESIVEGMLASIQTRINKQDQQKQTLTWKQEMYRSIIDKVNTFQSKYFSATSSSSLNNKNLYNASVSKTSNAAVTAMSTTKTSGTTVNIQVAQMATAASVQGSKVSSEGIQFDTDDFETGRNVTFDVIKGTTGFDITDADLKLDRNLVLKLGSTDITVDLNSIAGTGTGGKVTAENVRDQINRQLAATGSRSTVVVDGGKLKTAATDLSIDYSKSDAFALKSIGMPNKYTNTGVNMDATQSLSVNVGGVVRSVSYSYTEATTPGFMAGLGGKIQTAFGTDIGGNVSWTDPDADGVYTINSTDSGLTIKAAGKTTTPDKESVVIDFDLVTGTGTGGARTAQDVADYLNAQFAVKFGGGNVSTFEVKDGKLSSKGDGSFVYSIDTDKSDVFGLLSIGYTGAGVIAVDYDRKANLIVDLDGVQKNFSFTADEVRDSGTFMNDLKTKLTNAYGDSVKLTQDTGDATKWNLTTGSGQKVSLGDDISFAMGKEDGISTSLNMDSKISDIIDFYGATTTTVTLGDKTITLSDTDTLTAAMKKINDAGSGITMSYNSVGDTFALKSNTSGSRGAFGVSGALFDALKLTGTDATVRNGQNAVVNVNGQVIERISNSFTFDGMDIKLSNTTGNYDTTGAALASGLWDVTSGTDSKATISFSQNTDNTINILKSFTEDYNALIKELNGYTHEEATYRKYPPLSDAQKKDMTEKEIENWEEQAKIGLLRNDDEVEKLISNLRSCFSNTYSGSFLSNTGLDTSSNYSEYGALKFDETVVREKLSENPNAFVNFFTGTNSFSEMMNKSMKNSVNKSSGNQGSMVSLAGVVGYGSEKTNTIFTSLTSIQERIKELTTKYENRKAFLWAKFTAMESAISKIGAQSSYLGGQ